MATPAGRTLPAGLDQHSAAKFGIEISDGIDSVEMLQICFSNLPDGLRYDARHWPVGRLKVSSRSDSMLRFSDDNDSPLLEIGVEILQCPAELQAVAVEKLPRFKLRELETPNK